MEARRLVELLDADALLFDGFHDRLAFRVRGTIPGDREKMLQKLDDAIGVYNRQEPVVACS